MPSRTGIAALALALVVPAVAHAAAWQTYVNPRFGSTAEVPSDWQPGEAPANRDGLRFVSPDGQAWIIVYGGFQTFGTVGEAMALLEAPNEGEQITFRHRETRVLVISGLKRDRIFYRKSLLSCRDTIWNSIAIEYPAARKQVFDAIVTQMAKSLKPGKGEEATACEGQASSAPVAFLSTGTLRRSDQPGTPAQGAGTSRSTLTRQASAEPDAGIQGPDATSATDGPRDQDMQRSSDDMQPSHSDM